MRHVEELFFKTAHQDIGALDQGSDFLHQGVVKQAVFYLRVTQALQSMGHFQLGMTLVGLGTQLANHVAAALFAVGYHRAVLDQTFGVVIGMLEHHLVQLGLKSMPLSAVTRRQAQGLYRQHLTAVHGHQTMRGANKFHTAPSR